MQHFISDSKWDYRILLDKISQKTDQMMPRDNIVSLIIDESGMVKKGEHSVGVAKQYCGNVGKIENCQVAVLGCLASGDFSMLIDSRLYLPESWANNSIRCNEVGIPESEQEFKTKGQLAIDIIKHQKELGLRFDCVSFDAYYGKDLALQNEVDRMDITFVGDYPMHQHIYLMRPGFKVPKAKKRGKKPFVEKPTVKSMSVKEYVDGLQKNDFKKISIRHSCKGRLKAWYHFKKIYLCDESTQEIFERIMIIKKSIDKKGNVEIKCSMTNAKSDQFSEKDLAFMQNQRFFIEHSLRESKHEMGMDQYQTRKWIAWHHQMALIILSMFFVLKEKLICFAEWPLLSARDIRQIIAFYWKECFSEINIFDQLINRHIRRQLDINRSQ